MGTGSVSSAAPTQPGNRPPWGGTAPGGCGSAPTPKPAPKPAPSPRHGRRRCHVRTATYMATYNPQSTGDERGVPAPSNARDARSWRDKCGYGQRAGQGKPEARGMLGVSGIFKGCPGSTETLRCPALVPARGNGKDARRRWDTRIRWDAGRVPAPSHAGMLGAGGMHRCTGWPELGGDAPMQRMCRTGEMPGTGGKPGAGGMGCNTTGCREPVQPGSTKVHTRRTKPGRSYTRWIWDVTHDNTVSTPGHDSAPHLLLLLPCPAPHREHPAARASVSPHRVHPRHDGAVAAHLEAQQVVDVLGVAQPFP